MGKFENGRQHGFGKMSYASGAVFEGCWDDGRREGSTAEDACPEAAPQAQTDGG